MSLLSWGFNLSVRFKDNLKLYFSLSDLIIGDEGDLAVKLESLIECCNDVSLRSLGQESTYQHGKDKSPPKFIDRKSLPADISNTPNPSQASVCFFTFFAYGKNSQTISTIGVLYMVNSSRNVTIDSLYLIVLSWWYSCVCILGTNC